MKGHGMIKASLKFPLSTTVLVTKTILSLPEMLRPTSVSLAEDEPATAIGNVDVFLQTFKMPTIGVYLQGPTASYDVRRLRNNTLIVSGDLEAIPYDSVRDFLITWLVRIRSSASLAQKRNWNTAIALRPNWAST
jgi:hypothetical protein